MYIHANHQASIHGLCCMHNLNEQHCASSKRLDDAYISTITFKDHMACYHSRKNNSKISRGLTPLVLSKSGWMQTL